MTGAEHYAEAERLLEQVATDTRSAIRNYTEDANVLAAAQVHATLAQTAAVVLVGLAPTSMASEFHREVGAMRRAIGSSPAAPVQVPA